MDYELSAKRLRRNVLRVELDDEDLWDCEEYQQLEQRIAELQANERSGDEHHS